MAELGAGKRLCRPQASPSAQRHEDKPSEKSVNFDLQASVEVFPPRLKAFFAEQIKTAAYKAEHILPY